MTLPCTNQSSGPVGYCLCSIWRKAENPACLPLLWQFNLGLPLALCILFANMKRHSALLKAQLTWTQGKEALHRLHNGYSIAFKKQMAASGRKVKRRENSFLWKSLKQLCLLKRCESTMVLLFFGAHSIICYFPDPGKKSFPLIYSYLTKKKGKQDSPNKSWKWKAVTTPKALLIVMNH